MKKVGSWFAKLSDTGKVLVIVAALFVSFGTVEALVQPSPSENPPSSTTSQKTTPKVEIKPVTTTEVIPFTSSTTEDSNLDQGTTQTRTKGVNGVLTHTYKVTYTDGKETSRSAPIDSITTPAVNEVIVNGTKAPAPSCPNGTYVNTAGNTVCSPYSSSSAPAGASAQCNDGTYSFSQNRSGTCSHHGGVASWL